MYSYHLPTKAENTLVYIRVKLRWSQSRLSCLHCYRYLRSEYYFRFNFSATQRI